MFDSTATSTPPTPWAVLSATPATDHAGVVVNYTPSADDPGRTARIRQLGIAVVTAALQQQFEQAEEVRRYLSLRQQLETARRAGELGHAEAAAHKAKRRQVELEAPPGMAAMLQDLDRLAADASARATTATRDVSTLEPLLGKSREAAASIIAQAATGAKNDRVRDLIGRQNELIDELAAVAPVAVLAELADAMIASRHLDQLSGSIANIATNKLLGPADGKDRAELATAVRRA